MALAAIGASLLLMSACGQKTASKRPAAEATHNTALKLQAKTYVQKDDATGYQVTLHKDGSFVDRIVNAKAHTVQVRTGKYHLNHAKTVATFTPDKLAVATFESAAALKTNKAPLTVSRQEESAKLTATQKDAPSLRVSGDAVQRGTKQLRKQSKALQSYLNFYQEQQLNYSESYGQVQGLTFSSPHNMSTGGDYGHITFAGNKFTWQGIHAGNGGGTNEGFAEGRYSYDNAQQQLQLHITAKTPLYSGATDNPDGTISYGSNEASMFTQNDVTMTITKAGNTVTLSSKTPDLGTCAVDSSASKVPSVATMKTKATKTKGVRDIFPTAQSFANFISEMSGEDFDAGPKPTDETSFQYIEDDSDTDATDATAVYIVDATNVVPMDNDTPGTREEYHRFAIDESGAVYEGMPGMLMPSPDLTDMVQSKIGH